MAFSLFMSYSSYIKVKKKFRKEFIEQPVPMRLLGLGHEGQVAVRTHDLIGQILKTGI